jgi:hypothetical protein
MIKSIHFKVRKWIDTPYEGELITPRTDTVFGFHPLRSNTSKVAEGLAFIWGLELFSDSKMFLDYESEEFYLIDNKNISNKELSHIVLQSYRRTKEEVSIRNGSAGINATMRPFEYYQTHKHVSHMRQCLKTEY